MQFEVKYRMKHTGQADGLVVPNCRGRVSRLNPRQRSRPDEIRGLERLFVFGSLGRLSTQVSWSIVCGGEVQDGGESDSRG